MKKVKKKSNKYKKLPNKVVKSQKKLKVASNVSAKKKIVQLE